MPMISFAALSFANVSTFSACSDFLSSVASATCLSSALIPSSSAAISEASVEMLSLRSSIALPRSDTVSSNSFRSSSFLSMVFSQYSFFSSSAVCSLPSKTTMSSIIFKTFSKLTFLPLRARLIKFSRKSFWAPLLAKAASACSFTCFAFVFNCNNDGVGRVFLKSSSASSSLSSFTVSARANNSSARTLQRTAHSSSLVLQFFSKSFKKTSSAARLFAVSSRSSFWLARSTPSSPICAILLSIDLVRALISLVLAASNSLKFLIADSSSSVTSARVFSIVSVICFRMPTIWPLCGA
mmetsp:Transcript_76663/g.119785  ORF Transcript_76663/g.119785 Transcript_76663/m.119785 type:complete len:297 (+) Transcript_76663:718-1608(+)